MGLAISVGCPSLGDEEGEASYAADCARVSAALAAEGIIWSEPGDPPPYDAERPHLSSFSYSFLRYLCRAYALQWDDQPVTPATSSADLDAAEGIISDAISMLSSHLLCHSDCDGYYVPADFDDPLFLDQSLPGAGMIGSSQGLRRELVRIAPAIGVRLAEDGSLDDDEATRLAKVAEADPFGIEQTVWLTLYEASRVSIAHGNAIIFH